MRHAHARSSFDTRVRDVAHLQQCSLWREHSWRWRESNPRLPRGQWGFSERIRERCLGPPSLTGGERRPQPQCSVPPGPEASPGGEPLEIAPRFRPSGWAGRDALLVGTRQRVPCCHGQHLLCLPALLRRSGDVGSLPPPRSSKSKPRTPMSSAAPVHVGWRGPTRVPAVPGPG